MADTDVLGPPPWMVSKTDYDVSKGCFLEHRKAIAKSRRKGKVTPGYLLRKNWRSCRIDKYL